MKLIFLVSFMSTLFNTGLIWTIQLVHYPGFLKVGGTSHQKYHAFHMKAISPLVGASMMVELLSSVILVLFLERFSNTLLIWISLGLLAGIFLHTAFIAVPLHGKLSTAFSYDVANQLVQTNWWRTILWSFRSIMLTYVLMDMLR